MAVSLSYDDVLSRVRITVDGMGSATHATVERSTDGVRWMTVRGGDAAPIPTGGVLRLDDYEFEPGLSNTYRVRPTVSEDFETTALSLSVGSGASDAAWSRDDTTAHTGRWSLRSGAITHDQHSDAVITVPAGATTLTLWWRVSSESGWDFGRIVTDTGNVLATPGFESGLAPWGVAGGTAVQSSAQAHSGTYAAEVTPDGVSVQCYIESEMVPVAPGQDVGVSGWMWCTEAASEASVTINWYDASGTYMSSAHTPTTLAAGTWTQLSHSATAPEGAAEVSVLMRLGGTPPASNVFYADDVFLAIASEVASASGELAWTEVSHVDVTGVSTVMVRYTKDGIVSSGGDAVWIDDLAFGGFPAQSAAITPSLTQAWIKNLARPFLNRRVVVTDYSDIDRPSRGGTFDVVGRSYPVAVTDKHGSRRLTLEVRTDTVADRDDLDLVLSTGDPVLVHVPPEAPFPSLYAVLGDYTIRRVASAPHSPRRYFVLPLTEVAAPGPDVVGATVTWEGIAAAYATWSDLIAGESTWQDVVERIGSAEDVIVP